MEITLLLSKYSDACHDILEEIPMKDIQAHMRIMWIDTKEKRDMLEETVITTVPTIVVYDTNTHNRIIYQGNDFKTYWGEFVRSHTHKTRQVALLASNANALDADSKPKKPTIHVNKLNQLHSEAMMHVDKIRQSINEINANHDAYNERKKLLHDTHHTDGLHARLVHHMSQAHVDNAVQQPKQLRPFSLSKTTPSTIQHEQSKMQTIQNSIQAEHHKFKMHFAALETAQQTHTEPLKQLRMANSLLQQIPPA